MIKVGGQILNDNAIYHYFLFKNELENNGSLLEPETHTTSEKQWTDALEGQFMAKRLSLNHSLMVSNAL